MPLFTSVSVTKLDAARRQLETAINLYFHEGDQVSIHTLACAAHEIIETVNRKSGGKPTLKESWKDNIKPEYVKTFYNRLNSARNFFKHADRDTDKSIRFAPFASDIIMLDACWTYRRITGERLPVLDVFNMWAAITWARHFVTYPGLDLTSPEIVHWASLTRQEFFDMSLPVAHAAIVGTKRA